MKLTAIILLTTCLHVSAGVVGQTVTIRVRNTPMKEVFREIQKQTGLDVFVDEALLQKTGKITLDVRDMPVPEVLNLCLKNEPLNYFISDGRIVIRLKPTAVFQSVDTSRLPAPPPIDVHGRIVNENNEPVAGASVQVKGTNKGATTGNDGVFVLKEVDENATLEISYVGFETITVPVKNRDNFSFSLKRSESKLDEAQVIAYGTTTQRLNPGNVGTVKAADIEKQPVSNVLEAIAGRIPGIFIKQVNGLSGGAVAVRIQGQNSIGNGNDPFYVIDGVPYYSQLHRTGIDDLLGSSGNNAEGSPFSYINPADIESIDVLKDADATAIYGSRAANGAILITTKKGKAGAAKIDISFRQGVAKVTRKWDMMNTQQYLQMRREAFKNDGLTPNPNSDYDLLFWDTTRYTDWQKTLIGGAAQYTDVNGSISGGTNSVQYLVGGTYHWETTVFPGNFSDQKGAVHFNVSATNTDRRFRMDFSGIYMADINRLPDAGDLTRAAILSEPDAPALYNKDGSLNWAQNASGTSTWINPISYTYLTYRNKTTNLVGNALLSYHILPGLEVRSSFGYTNTQTNDFAPSPLSAIRPERRSSSRNVASFGNRNQNSWIIEPMVTYKRNIGNGKLDLLAGSTIQQNYINGGYIVGIGYNSDEQLENLSSAASFIIGTSFVTQYKYAALFGRLNYNWLDKYIIDLTLRRDGSSRFGADNQFHNFWSVAGAWLFSQENWMKNLHFLSFGKLRASYGTTGSDQIDDYKFLSIYNTVGNNGLSYQNRTGLAPAGLPNPFLQWEETRKLQGGIELGFFADRIYVNATYGLNRCSNQLLNTVLPSFVGYSSIAANFPATVQNTSWELSLQTVNIKSRSFQWTTNIALTIPRNKLLAFPNFDKSPYTRNLIIGRPLDIQRKLHFLGVDPATGMYQVADANGKPTISPSYPSDYTVLISIFPKYYGGLQNSISYKGLQLDFFFHFVKQLGSNSYSFMNGFRFPGAFFRGLSNQPVTVLDRWQKPGDKASIQLYSTQNNDNINYVINSNHFYTDASYIRLKNVSLSWQLPAKWKQSAHLQNARIYVQTQNLLTFTSYKGVDPENQSIVSLPPLRVWTFGFQLTL